MIAPGAQVHKKKNKREAREVCITIVNTCPVKNNLKTLFCSELYLKE